MDAPVDADHASIERQTRLILVCLFASEGVAVLAAIAEQGARANMAARGIGVSLHVRGCGHVAHLLRYAPSKLYLQLVRVNGTNKVGVTDIVL